MPAVLLFPFQSFFPIRNFPIHAAIAQFSPGPTARRRSEVGTKRANGGLRNAIAEDNGVLPPFRQPDDG
jgi:hypothetical protein